MNKTSSKEILVQIICGLFIVLFVYAAVSKIVDRETFIIQLQKSPILTSVASTIAWFVPICEIITALFLMIERTQLFALYTSFTFMVSFTAYIVVILNFSEFVPCSCGGILQQMSWHQHLIFNLVFVAAAGLAVYAYRESPKKILLRNNR